MHACGLLVPSNPYHLSYCEGSQDDCLLISCGRGLADWFTWVWSQVRKRYSENKLSLFCVYFVRLMWYYPFNLFSGCLYLAADMEVDILCYTKLPLYWPYQLYKNTSFPLTPSLLVALPHLVCTSQFVCGGVCRRGVVHCDNEQQQFCVKGPALAIPDTLFAFSSPITGSEPAFLLTM